MVGGGGQQDGVEGDQTLGRGPQRIDLELADLRVSDQQISQGGKDLGKSIPVDHRPAAMTVQQGAGGQGVRQRGQPCRARIGMTSRLSPLTGAAP